MINLLIHEKKVGESFYLLDIPVILTPHSGHIDPPTGSWFLRT